MGITTNDYFEYIYNVIFSPKDFFEKKDIKISVRLALATVILIAVINKLSSGVFDGSIVKISFISSLILKILSIVFMWFLTALFFEYIAKIFYKDGNMNKLLFYSAFAPVPYIFFAPLNLLKQSGTYGYMIASFAELIIYFWIITLYAQSIKSAYDISLPRSFMLILLPIISVFFSIYWSVCFFSKLGAIFSL